MNIDQETLSSLLSRVSLSLPRLITAVVIFAIMLFLAGLVAKLIQRACNRRKLDREATLLLSRLGRYGTITLGIIWGLKQVNFDVTGFVAALGILGFTIGFALQDISKNFVAGILLLWQQPFNIGDTISVNGFSGAVMDISLRATEIRNLDGLQVFIPNADVYTNPLTNYSKAQKRRVGLRAGVSYDTDLDLATRTALAAVQQVRGLVSDPAPSVIFDTFGEQLIGFILYYWIDTSQADFGAAQDQGLKVIKEAFQREHITLPIAVRALMVQQTAVQ
jgi:small conductance mechanosensitive channel